MATIVPLPPSFTINALYSFTGSVVDLKGTPRDAEFFFDFQKLTFIDGSGLTVFCNTLELLLRLNVKVRFTNHTDISREAIVYLDDCRFFERYLGSKLRQSASIRSTTLPFETVAHAQAYSWLEHTFTPWMSRVLSVPHGALGSVRSSIKEVFNNIIDHSTQESGFIHVQHYPNRSDVRISISDIGKGIPANVRGKFPAIKNDGAAILRAAEPGFTTKSRKTNMGVGLDVLIGCVTGNHGSVNIVSFQGTLRCRASSSGALRQPTTAGTSSYPGTLVELILRTDRFIGDDAEETEVTW